MLQLVLLALAACCGASAKSTSYLRSGQSLNKGSKLVSPNGRWVLQWVTYGSSIDDLALVDTHIKLGKDQGVQNQVVWPSYSFVTNVHVGENGLLTSYTKDDGADSGQTLSYYWGQVGPRGTYQLEVRDDGRMVMYFLKPGNKQKEEYYQLFPEPHVSYYEPGDTLYAGQALLPGDKLRSRSGQYELQYTQDTGDLVLKNTRKRGKAAVVWSTQLSHSPAPDVKPVRIALQPWGTLNMWEVDSTGPLPDPSWSNLARVLQGRGALAAYKLVVEDSGEVVAYEQKDVPVAGTWTRMWWEPAPPVIPKTPKEDKLAAISTGTKLGPGSELVYGQWLVRFQDAGYLSLENTVTDALPWVSREYSDNENGYIQVQDNGFVTLHTRWGTVYNFYGQPGPVAKYELRLSLDEKGQPLLALWRIVVAGSDRMRAQFGVLHYSIWPPQRAPAGDTLFSPSALYVDQSLTSANKRFTLRYNTAARSVEVVDNKAARGGKAGKAVVWQPQTDPQSPDDEAVQWVQLHVGGLWKVRPRDDIEDLGGWSAGQEDWAHPALHKLVMQDIGRVAILKQTGTDTWHMVWQSPAPQKALLHRASARLE